MEGTRVAPTSPFARQRLDARVARFVAAYPPLLQVLLLALFFLPLQSVQIPGYVVGFSINPARLLFVLGLLLLIATKCARPTERVLRASRRFGRNRVLTVILFFLCASVVYYYLMVAAGQSVRFAPAESFFRSWRGRPVGQLVALLTYAILPYLLILRYSGDLRRWRVIGGALVGSALLLVAYGYFQQASFHAGLPVTGRLLYEGAGEELRPATFRAGGVTFLRFYSLGGEPREYGAFAIGATLLYVAWRYGGKFSRLTVMAMAASILLTLSATALIVLAVVLPIAVVDAARNGWIRPGTLIRSATVLILASGILLLTPAGGYVMARPAQYWAAAQSLRQLEPRVSYLLQAQAADLAVAFYVMEMPQLPLHRLLFGFGFGNSNSGMHDIVLERFGRDLMQEGALEDTRSYFFKILVELGIVGVVLFALLFFRTLRLSRALVDDASTPEERVRMIALRYAYIAFFVGGMIQVSFYHFIIMALIEGAPDRTVDGHVEAA